MTTRGRRRLGDVADAVLLVAPGALIAYAGFRGGGYFPDVHGELVVGLVLLAVLRVTLLPSPLAGATRALVLAAGAMALLVAWTLASALWSGSTSRALLAFDRGLVYLLALVVFGSLPMTPARLRSLLRGVALGGFAVCAAALLSQTLPEVIPGPATVLDSRLSYPVTYWNTLGLLGALEAILCLHLTCSEHERRWMRVLAAMALPVLATTVYLTSSRAAIGVLAIGLVLYLLLGRPRALVGGLVAGGSAAVVATAATYATARTVGANPTTPAAVAAGHTLGLVVLTCVVAGAGLRVLMFSLDTRVASRWPRQPPRRALAAFGAAAVAIAAVGFVALDGSRLVSRQYDLFVAGPGPPDTGDLAARLTNPASNKRTDLWSVAIRAFAAHPLQGTGADTYQLAWERWRPYESRSVNAHSLYLELMSELGVVGLFLLAVVVVTLLVGMARRRSGPERDLFSVLLAIAAGLLLHAALDWDWEMPVVMLWLFALGGAALAVPPHDRGVGAPASVSASLRMTITAGLLLLAVIPARVMLSEVALNQANAALRRGDCVGASGRALASVGAMPIRPEPRALLGYCQLRAGQIQLALRSFREAVRADPGNWRYHYGLAVGRAAAGLDPLPEVREAQRLNPREGLVADARRRFSPRHPSLWRERALYAPAPPST